MADDEDADDGEDGDDGGWVPVPGVGEPPDTLEFDTLDFLDELANPTRARIVRRLKEPNTIAGVAEALDVPVTRLYHHVKRLEAAEVIRVVATRQVGSVTERRYQVVARSFMVGAKFLESHNRSEVATALGSIFDMAKLGLQTEVETGALDFTREDTGVLSFGHVTLTPERSLELMNRLTALIEEFGDDPDPAESHADAEPTRVALFIAAHPTTD